MEKSLKSIAVSTEKMEIYRCRLGGNGIAIAKLNPDQSNK
jgi:hypothetical protein